MNNLKRRIESLPPLSVTEFQKQSASSHSSTFDDAGEESDDASTFQQSCVPCEQHYTNWKAWQAHLKSRNHTKKSAEFASKPSFESEAPSLSDLSLISPGDDEPEDPEVFNPSLCLFCNEKSDSMDSNLAHMTQTHKFLIPEQNHLIDTEFFLGYLFAIVAEFRECLFCGHSRNTKLGVQAHMRDRSHCKIDLENDEHQLRQFYDFPDVAEEEPTPIIDGNELRLPSGKILGHRSDLRQFRQNHVERTSSSSTRPQLCDEDESETGSALADSGDRRVAMRAGTSTSLIGLSEIQQRALIAVEKKIMKAEARAKNEYQAHVERGGNKQKRYRVLTMGKKAGGLEKRLG